MKPSVRIIIVLSIMILITAVPILLFSGVIQIPFADIPVFGKPSGEEYPPVPTYPMTEVTDEQKTEAGTHENIPETGPDTDEKDPGPVYINDAERFLDAVPFLNQDYVERGCRPVDEKYDEAKHILMRFTDLKGIYPANYSYNNSVREYYLRSDKKKENPIIRTEKEPAVHPRMGFIFIDSRSGVSMYGSDGRLIYDSIPEDVKFVGARDQNDAPVFLIGDQYRYFSYDKNEFIYSPYDPRYDYRGAEFDYPSYYGKPDSDVIREHNSYGNWIYRYKNGGQIVGYSYRYKGAYAFRYGFGLLYDRKDRMFFHSERSGTPTFSDLDLMRPERDGIESLGYYFFDHGLMRARLVTYDRKGNIETDREAILGHNGKEFFLNPDYKVISYSDGTFLMKKDGRYGYMSHEGKWICDPSFTYAEPFIEGLGVIGYSDGRKGVMDTEGKWVIPPVFDEITNCSGGIIAGYCSLTGWEILIKSYPPAQE